MNNLNPGQIERLTLLIEECSEVIKASTKILRFGNSTTNLKALEEEIGDCSYVMDMLAQNDDVKVENIIESYMSKPDRMREFVMYQKSTSTFIKPAHKRGDPVYLPEGSTTCSEIVDGSEYKSYYQFLQFKNEYISHEEALTPKGLEVYLLCEKCLLAGLASPIKYSEPNNRWEYA